MAVAGGTTIDRKFIPLTSLDDAAINICGYDSDKHLPSFLLHQTFLL